MIAGEEPLTPRQALAAARQALKTLERVTQQGERLAAAATGEDAHGCAQEAITAAFALADAFRVIEPLLSFAPPSTARRPWWRPWR
jgi:hypothetical protein